MLIRDAIVKALPPQEFKPGGTTLWCSDIGNCPRRAMFRVLGRRPESEFPLELREKFRWGNVFEAETGRALKAEFGDKLVEQFRLETKIWHGNVDFYLTSPSPLLIEHKAVNDNSFGYIPKEPHIAQIVLYGQLFEELYNKKPQLILVYRSWSHYAEFEIVDKGSYVSVKGKLDGQDYLKDIQINITKMREYLERYFGLHELPPYKKVDECLFKNKPSCQFFNQCRSEKKADF